MDDRNPKGKEERNHMPVSGCPDTRSGPCNTCGRMHMPVYRHYWFLEVYGREMARFETKDAADASRAAWPKHEHPYLTHGMAMAR